MRARLGFAAAITLSTLGALLACGDEDASRFGFDSDASASADGSAPVGPTPVGSASGVVVLHAAAFPAFRLCFENYPELPPLPDSTVMPEANVVGVEVGSVVRIPPLERPPGKVFVVDQRKARAAPREPQERRCGEILDGNELTINLDYQLAGTIDDPLGVGHVDVLAITGCGGGAWLDELGIARTDCADWNPTAGSLHARTVPVYPTFAATTTQLPVQVVHMSSLLETQRADGEEIEVSFGELDPGSTEPLAQSVVTSPPLFDASAPTTLLVDQTTESVFGSHGFRIALRSNADAGADGGASFVVDQTLAEVQELSFPQTVPTTYYLAASNYVLLLLGDPRLPRAAPDGGRRSGAFDARRAVHLLAIPVKEEVESDAGVHAPSDGS